MPGPQPLALMVSNRQQAILHGLVRRQTSPQRLVYRAKAILAATAGNSNAHIAQQLGLNRNTVRTWRRRWWSAVENLAEAEAAGATDKVLLARIEAVLDDAPRPGTPETFSAEQLTQIIAVACEAPEASGRPVTHWTPRELTQEVIQRGIVERISVRTVGRFLKRSRS
jgi:putative transposase